MKQDRAKIVEIFTSIQGEGPYIGAKQLFIRFCGCNLKCGYCDTNDESNTDSTSFSPEELKSRIEEFNLKSVHSISLTGGEPLLWGGFLADFLPLIKHKIYLETNSTLKDNLEQIILHIDIISADIKLPSSSGIENSFAFHDEFFKIVKKYHKEVFAKIVFDENILDDEIHDCVKLAEKYDLELILQPKTVRNEILITKEKMLSVFDKFLALYSNTRLIPQTHKFLGVE